MSSVETFIDLSAETLVTRLINGVQTEMRNAGITDWALYPGDERRIFLESIAPVMQTLFASVNQSCMNRLLDYAYGVYLDAIGEMWGCPRLVAKKSKCTLKLTISKARTLGTVIPRGTKATADNVVIFSTTQNATIPIGATECEVEAESVTGGSVANNYQIGDISSMVSNVPYITGVTNTTVPTGADDGEPYPENDDGVGDNRYRERIKLARTAYSTCGSVSAYQYFAKSANATVQDVKVVIPEQEIENVLTGTAITGKSLIPEKQHESGLASSTQNDVYINTDTMNVYLCTTGGDEHTAEWVYKRNLSNLLSAGNINLYAICNGQIEEESITSGHYEGGCLPSAEVLNQILESCSSDERRPLGDIVNVLSPETYDYDISLVYYTTHEDETAVMAAIENEDGAIQKYIEWQCSEIGKHINPDELEFLCRKAGGVRVEVTSPVHTDLTQLQLAHFSGNITVSHQLVSGY